MIKLVAMDIDGTLLDSRICQKKIKRQLKNMKKEV